MNAWHTVRLIAHRCGGALAPENSLSGLRAAHARGYRAVEFDVMLSADGTPVLIHDETQERTTTGHGRVAATRDAELFRLSLACGAFADWPDEPVPRLAEAAQACRDLGLLANVEIKPATGTDAVTARRVAADVAHLWREAPPPLLSSFSETALAVAREVAPDLPRALLVERVPADWAMRVARLGCVALHCASRQLSWRWLPEARHLGLAVRCYTVNRPPRAARLFARGIDAVFTDALDRLQE